MPGHWYWIWVTKTSIFVLDAPSTDNLLLCIQLLSYTEKTLDNIAVLGRQRVWWPFNPPAARRCHKTAHKHSWFEKKPSCSSPHKVSAHITHSDTPVFPMRVIYFGSPHRKTLWNIHLSLCRCHRWSPIKVLCCVADVHTHSQETSGRGTLWPKGVMIVAGSRKPLVLFISSFYTVPTITVSATVSPNLHVNPDGAARSDYWE